MRKTRGLIIGPSGVGKGYGLGSILTEYHGAPVFVSGDWCRQQHAAVAQKGVLVDDNGILRANEQHYNALGCPDRYFFDCPRSLDQAKQLLAWFGQIGTDQVVVFHMHAERHVCEQRIIDRATRQGRADDADLTVIQRRLSVYYSPGGLLHTVVPFLKDSCNHFELIDANPDLEHVVRPLVINHHCRRVFPVAPPSSQPVPASVS